MRKKIVKTVAMLSTMFVTSTMLSFGSLSVTAQENKAEDRIQCSLENETEIGEDLVEGSGIIRTLMAYRTHLQNIGWQGYKVNGEISGTTGKCLRMEGIQIYFDAMISGDKVWSNSSGSIEYRTNVQNEGWQDYVSDGELSGTVGKNLRLEAIQIRLTGNVLEKYDIYYRTHIQDKGWLGWAVNNQKSGSTGLSKQMEAIQIRLVEKGEVAPGTTEDAYIRR